MTPTMATTRSTAANPNRLQIDFLFLDLTSCTRCQGTDQNLEAALDAVRQVLEATGTDVEVNKIHVESAEHARELRFVSSPTITINDRDVALEFRESSCDSPCCTDGYGGRIACRTWMYEGREHPEPPVAMIVDAILRQVYAGAAVEAEVEAEPYELPENLDRFFAGKCRTQAAAVPQEAACCAPIEQRSCRDDQDKAECCGPSTVDGCS